MKPKRHFEQAVAELANADPHGSGTRLKAATPRPSSEPLVLRHARVRAILIRYLSPILVDSVLERTLQARGVPATALGGAALADVTSDIMVGLRLFVPEERLSELMLELADVLEPEVR